VENVRRATEEYAELLEAMVAARWRDIVVDEETITGELLMAIVVTSRWDGLQAKEAVTCILTVGSLF
jgi:hypothetical protein